MTAHGSAVSVARIDLAPGTFRRVPLPWRTVDDRVVLARTGDDGAIVLDPVSTVVWDLVSDWKTLTELEAVLAEHLDEMDRVQAGRVVREVLEFLCGEGVVERSGA